MKRDTSALTKNVYDLLVIGGGIYGACVAWDAVLRGLSVALVEKADFGSATSANSLKIIHGGLRYLQHGDLKRMRESICERRALMRIAPHLVHPLPVIIATYGHWMRGKEVVALALMINDLISADRNRLEDPQKHIPRGRVISQKEVLELVPGLLQHDLTGGAIFFDAQVYNSEQLLLSFLHSASKAGADVANYVEVTGFLRDKDCVIGVEAKDGLTDDRFQIRARMVVNTSGPWVNRVMGFLSRPGIGRRVRFAKAINLVTRPLCQTYAVGISCKTPYSDADSVIDKGARFLFITPWRGRSVIGTTYAAFEGDPDHFKVSENDIHNFLNEINQAYPSASLKMEDVSLVHGGLLPISGDCPKTGTVRLSKQYQVYDHRKDGVKGLVSVVGVKYTTARQVAEKVVDRVFESWGQTPPQSMSSVTPLHGGEIKRFDDFLHTEIAKRPSGLGEDVTRRLVYNYGSAYPDVLRYFAGHAQGDGTYSDHRAVLKAEVLHGIRDEMAEKLADVVFRRTELGTAGHPGEESLRFSAEIMRQELGWSPARCRQELQDVEALFASKHSSVRGDGSKLAGTAVQ
jgi:glycerol-3-phosphate dehydrogenase